MTIEDAEDEAFSELLRNIARTPDVSALRRDIGPGSELLDRFVIGRQMGEGGMGRVFAAFDRQRQTMVAVKMLGILTPGSILAIRQEFRIAEQLVHPHLVRLHELFSEGQEWFFTMDLLEGVTLRQWRAAQQGLDVDSLRHVFRQLAASLAALHVSGILHGDLKPSNFLIVGAEQRVVLLDFGVARPLGETSEDYEFAGTREYGAPEQSAGQQLTEAADWYSFGVVLFEALSGRLPSQIPLEVGLQGAPPELAALCRELLENAPERRPNGVSVQHALGEIQKGARPSSQPPVAKRRLIGRQREFERLFDAYTRVGAGRPQIVLVRGDSGIGKTALVEHFVQEVASRGAIVLAARCREREATSYKAVDGLIDDLVRYLDRMPREAAANILPDGIEELTLLFPTLRTAAVVIAKAVRGSLEGSDRSVVKQKAIASFRDLLVALGERAPLVVWIDDLQWSDVHSAALLEPILSGPKPASVLFVGGCRAMAGALRGSTIDVLYGQKPEGLPEPLVIDLLPLELGDAESLARELLPDSAADPAAARAIAREAEGSPLFIAELVHQRGSAAVGPPGASQTLNELVRRRVQALPEEARGLLEATALAGVPLSRNTARRARGLTANQAEDAIDLLRANHLARTFTTAEERNVEMHHDRIREIVLQGLTAEVKREHHLRLARALEAERSVEPEMLAGHFFAGGQPIEAGRYWIKAAEAALEALAFGHAADLYERGCQFARLDPERLGVQQVRRAEALAYDGKGVDSANLYLTIAEGRVQDQAIELRRRAAEQLLLSGHLQRGLDVIALVLRGLGMRSTRSGPSVLFSILIGRLLVRLRGLRFKSRKASEISQRELARVDASWSIACSLGVIDFMRGADFQNDHLLLALHAGEPLRLLRAIALEISYAATPGPGSVQRTAALLKIANRLAGAVNDSGAAGLVKLTRGVAAYLNGRFDEALVECQAGISSMSRYSGAVWVVITAQRFMVASLFHLGRLSALGELVPPLLADAEAKGNLYASTFFRTTYSNLAWLVSDRVDVAREQLSLARREWTAPGVQLSHCWMLVGEANFAFYTGETHELWRQIQREWPRLVAARFLRIAMLRIQLWHLRSFAALSEARARERGGQPSEARRLREDARQSAVSLGKQRIRFARPLAELSLAALDSAAGNANGARRRLTRCIEQFSAEDMRLYVAGARMRLGELIGADEGAELIRVGRAAFEAEGVVNVAGMLAVLTPAVGH